jgi:hypothetical protein
MAGLSMQWTLPSSIRDPRDPMDPCIKELIIEDPILAKIQVFI